MDGPFYLRKACHAELSADNGLLKSNNHDMADPEPLSKANMGVIAGFIAGGTSFPAPPRLSRDFKATCFAAAFESPVCADVFDALT